MTDNLPVPDDLPHLNLSQSEIDELRKNKNYLTEYAREKLRKLIYDQDIKKMEEAAKNLVLENLTHEEMLEEAAKREAAKREAANELYQDALHELDYIAVGGQDMEEFMSSYLVIQTALKVALGEEDV